jgi:GNAT superfamily N-acetyltransferase
MAIKIHVEGREDIESDVLRKIRHRFEEKGLGKAIIWFIVKSLKGIVLPVVHLRKYYVLERSLTGDLPFIRATMDVTCKLGSIEDLMPFQGVLNPWRRWHRSFEERLRRGQICIVCQRGEQTIGYIWVSSAPEKDKHLGVTIQPGKDGSYGFDLFVLPEYRKFLIGFELISRWLEYARKEGMKRAIGLVQAINKPMLMTTKLAFGFKYASRSYALEFLRYRGVVISKRGFGQSGS